MNHINATFRCVALLLSLATRQPYRTALVLAVCCASLCGVAKAADSARARLLAAQLAANPLPADLTPIASPSQISSASLGVFTFSDWPCYPPLTPDSWRDWPGAQLFWSPSLKFTWVDNRATAAMQALAASVEPPPIPGGTNGLWTDDSGGGTVTPQIDLSTNTTDLYLQIAYLDTNTVRVTLTNTHPRIYELQTKTAITDTNWVSEKVLEGVTPMTPTNITMGTRTRLFFRGRTYMPTNGQLFITVPSSFTDFHPLVNGSVYTGSPVAEFPSQKLYALNPPLYSVNLGYQCDDYWPGYNFPNTPPGSPVSNAQQNATAVLGLPGCANLTNFCASRNPVTELSLYSMPNLQDAECYNAGLTSVRVTQCSSLTRATFESNSITGTLDMSGCTSLGDFRAAANYITNAVFSGAEHSIWHLCLRDSPNLNPDFAATTLSNFTELQELILWDAGQAGALTLPSTNLTWVQVYDNQFTEINFTNCGLLTHFWASGNQLSAEALDKILAALQAAPYLNYLDLRGNGFASPVGYSNFVPSGIIVGRD